MDKGKKHQEILYHITCKNMQCEKYKLYYAGELLKKAIQYSKI